MTHPVSDFANSLAQTWKAEAERLRRRGLKTPSRLVASLARELEERAQEWLDTELTMAEAVEISGLSYSTLQQRLKAGELPNLGETGRPRVRRGDLPRKVGAQRRSGVPPDENAFDLIDQALLDLER